MTREVRIEINSRSCDDIDIFQEVDSGWKSAENRAELEALLNKVLKGSGLIDDTFVVELYKHPEPQDLEPSARDFRYGD